VLRWRGKVKLRRALTPSKSRADRFITVLVFCGRDDAFDRLLLFYLEAIANYPMRLFALDSVVKKCVLMPERPGPAHSNEVGRGFRAKPAACTD
jgi:hypothetical protein